MAPSVSAAASRPEFDNAAETTHKQLAWTDFKGKKAKVTRWEGAWAHSVLSLRLSRSEMLTEEDPTDGTWIARAATITAYSVFDKYLSAVNPGARKETVLAHEQLHFDLSEAFSLDLTRSLRALSARGIGPSSARLALSSAIEEAYGATRSELLGMQARYDDEANHGTKRKQQAAWSKVITDMLEAARSASSESTGSN